MRTSRPALILRWLPAFAAAAYVATVLTLWHRLVTNNNWDSDVVSKLVLADRLRGSGPVHISHYGDWTSLWWLLATRWLPHHRDIWTVSGYAWTLAGALVLGWATWRVAGSWAGVTAAATMIVVGPFALRSFLSTTGAHLTAPVAAIVVSVVLLTVTRSPRWAVTILGGAFAGASAASDPLVWFAAVVPFALAAALVARRTRRRDVRVHAAAFLALTVAAGVVTNGVMRALDFHIGSPSFGLASLHDLPHNVLQLARMVALLGGANYALPGGYPHEPLRLGVALLAFAAIVAPLLAFAVRRSAYALYWAASVAVLALLFVVTPNAVDLGPKSVNYVLTFAPAAGVGVALLARSPRAQLAAALCIALVAGVNIASIANSRAEVTGVVALPQHAEAIVRTLEREHARYGYAGFWSSFNLAWQSNMRVVVAAVNNCGAELCPNRFFTIESWYHPHRGRSFLLVDATIPDIKAPEFAKNAAKTVRFGPLTLYVFDDDIAARIRGIAPS
jgi:MFS family permease